MLSYAHGASGIPLIGRTLGDHLDLVAAGQPDHEAIVSLHQDSRLTYRQLVDAVDEVARGLLALGVERGDRVGIWATNSIEWVLVQFATAKIGAILVTINPAYRITELEYAVNKAGLRTLVVTPRFKSSDYMAMVREVAPELDAARPGELRAARVPSLRDVIVLDASSPPGTMTLDDVRRGGDQIPADELSARQGRLQFDDAINIQYTSGTTGSPKGVVLTHHNLLNDAYFHGEVVGVIPESRLCGPLPFYHCGGMVTCTLAALTRGATLVLPSEAFDPRAVLEAVQRESCTVLNGVPTMFIAELNDPERDRFDLTSLRSGFMGGAPCPVEVVRRVRSELHISDLVISFGQTETSPVITTTTRDDEEDKRVATVGRPFPHIEIKVVDPLDGQILPRGVAGEVCARGFAVMLGYWDDAESTAQTIDSARWLHTGDVGVMDEQGYVNITGRKKDMIIRGGENIYPREIEEFLYLHPSVEDVQVVGVPDERWGEEVAAFVKLRAGAAATPEELREFGRGKIAHFKVPAYVFIVDEFPMTVTGKIQKFRLRDIAVELLGRQGAASVVTA